MSRPDGENHCCKVGRVGDRYGLDDLDGALRHRRSERDASLRRLAAFVNARVLAAVVESAGVETTGDPLALYETLYGEDAAPERKADVRDRLEYAGVDLEELEGDFVSHQTIRAHLNDCLEVDTSRRGVSSVEAGREIIEWARDRDEHIIEQTLAQLARKGLLGTGDLEVRHSVTVRCTDCGEAYRPTELLSSGGCACAGDEG